MRHIYNWIDLWIHIYRAGCNILPQCKSRSKCVYICAHLCICKFFLCYAGLCLCLHVWFPSLLVSTNTQSVSHAEFNITWGKDLDAGHEILFFLVCQQLNLSLCICLCTEIYNINQNECLLKLYDAFNAAMCYLYTETDVCKITTTSLFGAKIYGNPIQPSSKKKNPIFMKVIMFVETGFLRRAKAFTASK